MESKLLFEKESYELIGAFFEVYNEKGNGFKEPVYQECMEIELGFRRVNFEPQKHLLLTYKGVPLQSNFKPDFVCFKKIIVELKAVSELTDEHRSQVFNYLKATRLQLGFLVNFGAYPKLQYERIIH